MVSTLNQDANGDIALDAYGNFELVSASPYAVAVLVKRALLTKLGELSLAVDTGVDFDRIYSKPTTQKIVVDAILQNVILGVDGVDRVVYFNSELREGNFVFACQILTIYGEEKLSGGL